MNLLHFSLLVVIDFLVAWSCNRASYGCTSVIKLLNLFHLKTLLFRILKFQWSFHPDLCLFLSSRSCASLNIDTCDGDNFQDCCLDEANLFDCFPHVANTPMGVLVLNRPSTILWSRSITLGLQKSSSQDQSKTTSCHVIFATYSLVNHYPPACPISQTWGWAFSDELCKPPYRG